MWSERLPLYPMPRGQRRANLDRGSRGVHVGPILQHMLNLGRLLVVTACVSAMGAMSTPAYAQLVESASGLSVPAASDGSRPARPDAPSDAQPLADVPPPPAAAGYNTPVYPTTGDAASDSEAATSRTDNPDLRIPSRIATRMRVLEGSLQAIAARGGNSIVDGILSLLSGGLSISLGIWVKTSGDDNFLSTYLFLWGTTNVARGILDLALSPNATKPAITFAHMPMSTMDEVRERLRFGENALEKMARRRRITRILDASLNIAAGVAVVPFYLGPNEFKVDDPFDYFVIIGSGISVITGIINLATRSNAERRWSAYEELRDRLVREEEGAEVETTAAARVQLMGAGIAPLRGGAALNVAAQF